MLESTTLGFISLLPYVRNNYTYLFGYGQSKKVATPSRSYIQSDLVVSDIDNDILQW